MHTFRPTLVAGLTVVLCAGAFVLAGREGGKDDSVSYLADLSRGKKPSLLLYTDEQVYQTGAAATLTLDVNDNGINSAKTWFLYWQDMSSGEIRYMSQAGGLQAAGTIVDFAGNGPDNFQTFQIVDDTQTVIAPAEATAAAGTYQFVWEYRDATGQRVFLRVNWIYGVVDSFQEMAPSGEVTADTTLTSDTGWLITDQAKFVRDGATLTIEPGTFILGTGQASALVVDRGGRINARGTAARPIVMTSQRPVGQRARTDWGGLIINGSAPINVPGGEAQGEGDTGLYGGNDPLDSSGVYSYLRVEFAGIEFSPDNELNGIAFQGVGAGTQVDHIQVHFNKDDGVEFFGGTVDARYVLLTGIGDDSLDWVRGWVGRVQFLVAQQRGDDADQGVEADNQADNTELEPRSAPTIYNATFIGAPTNEDGDESDTGILLREGTAGELYNFIVTGFKETGVDIDTLSSFTQAQQGNLVFDNSIIFGNNPNFADDEAEGGPFTSADFMTINMENNRVVDPELRDPFNFTTPDYRPGLESPARDLSFVKRPPDDGFFDTTVDFIGGVNPLDDWTKKGWAIHVPF